MSDSNWNVDPGVSPPTRDDAWFPPSMPSSPPAQGTAGSMSSGMPSSAPSGHPHGYGASLASADLASTPASPSPSLQRRGGPRRLLASLAVGVALALSIGFVAGRATSSSSPSEVLANATSGGPATQPVGATPAPLTGNEVDPAAAVAKVLGPAAVQLESSNDLGSGFIYDSSGLILTAAHVVGSLDTMTVRLADGTQTQGKVVGSDAGTDIAVLRIDVGHKLPVAPLALGVPVKVGQSAIALGSPYGLDQTVTAGIVSAVGRAVNTKDNGEVAMIQTDAPINPGNSGGMLANRYGQVIGVNDSIISNTGSDGSGSVAGNVGVGFAIPIDLAKSIADRLVAGTPIEYGYLGVTIGDSTGSMAGGQVSSVEPGSPADKAGLEKGDVVIKVDDNAVGSGTDLAAAVRAHQPGDRVKLTYLRGGKQSTVTVTVTKSP